jgi:hypothetical protein
MNQSYRYGIRATAWGPIIGNNLDIIGYACGEGNASVGTYGWVNGDKKNIWGVFGDVDGNGTGGRYAIYGETFGASDSVYAGYFIGNIVYTGGFYKPSDAMFKSKTRGATVRWIRSSHSSRESTRTTAVVTPASPSRAASTTASSRRRSRRYSPSWSMTSTTPPSRHSAGTNRRWGNRSRTRGLTISS